MVDELRPESVRIPPEMLRQITEQQRTIAAAWRVQQPFIDQIRQLAYDRQQVFESQALSRAVIPDLLAMAMQRLEMQDVIKAVAASVDLHQIMERARAHARTLGSVLQPVLEQMRQAALSPTFLASISRVAAELTRQVNWTDLFAEAGARIREGELAREAEGLLALEDAGFGFAAAIAGSELLAALMYMEETARAGAVTNYFLGIARRPVFRSNLLGMIAASPTMRWRLRSITSGLANHDRRDYYSSIPTLLPQMEGIVTDAVALTGCVEVRGHTVYALGPDGKRKQGPKSKKPVELNGMVTVLQQTAFMDVLQSFEIQVAAEFLMERFATQRNTTAHGRQKRFTARASVQAILLIYTWAKYIADRESR